MALNIVAVSSMMLAVIFVFAAVTPRTSYAKPWELDSANQAPVHRLDGRVFLTPNDSSETERFHGNVAIMKRCHGSCTGSKNTCGDDDECACGVFRGVHICGGAAS